MSVSIPDTRWDRDGAPREESRGTVWNLNIGYYEYITECACPLALGGGGFPTANNLLHWSPTCGPIKKK